MGEVSQGYNIPQNSGKRAEPKEGRTKTLSAFIFRKEGAMGAMALDLHKFFDEVNHDLLMAKLRRRVLDRRVILLVNPYFRTIKEDCDKVYE